MSMVSHDDFSRTSQRDITTYLVRRPLLLSSLVILRQSACLPNDGVIPRYCIRCTRRGSLKKWLKYELVLKNQRNRLKYQDYDIPNFKDMTIPFK